jgi:hypothetical protein
VDIFVEVSIPAAGGGPAFAAGNHRAGSTGGAPARSAGGKIDSFVDCRLWNPGGR